MIGTSAGPPPHSIANGERVLAGGLPSPPVLRRVAKGEGVVLPAKAALLTAQQVPLETTGLFSSAWLFALLFHCARPPDFSPAWEAVSWQPEGLSTCW